LASAPSQAYEACLIGADGHITMRVDLHCADDEAATQSAKQLNLMSSAASTASTRLFA
jgi:hypothetical protein